MAIQKTFHNEEYDVEMNGYTVLSGISLPDFFAGIGSIRVSAFSTKAKANQARARLSALVAHREYMDKQAENERIEKMVADTAKGDLPADTEIPKKHEMAAQPPVVPEMPKPMDEKVFEIPLTLCAQLITDLKSGDINAFSRGYELVKDTTVSGEYFEGAKDV
jgi:hypothetical protein